MTITHYVCDDERIYSHSEEHSKYDPIPANVVLTEPPSITGAEVARWTGSAWEVLAERPEPEPAPAVVPQVVSRAQGKAVLISMGIWPFVVAFVDAIEDPTERALAEVALYDTVEWRRDSAFLATAAAALSISEEQLDGMFITAAEIQF